MRVLVVEDEPAIAAGIRATMAGEGWAADLATDGPEALEWASAYAYDLVVLDVILPGLNGFEVCSALRAAGINSPILMLTARDSVEDRVAGLDRGADDYLAKPFAMAELLARARALRRRRSTERAPTTRAADIEIDPARHTVTRSGKLVDLTPREFALLETLVVNRGQVLSRDRLIEAVWNADFSAESNIVEVYIRSLRRKLDDGRRDGLIETVRGVGYRFRADPSAAA